ncbi:MAG TPA: ABC transporter substrate-binding protein [Bacillota bacterium]
MRIVSLVPSGTELVVELGLAEQLVGISHQCNWPPVIQHLPRVTRSLVETGHSPREISLAMARHQKTGLPTYAVDGELLAGLAPDVVLAQDVCEVCAVPERVALATVAEVVPRARLVTLKAQRLGDVLAHVEIAGRVLGAEEPARRMTAALESRLTEIHRRVTGRARPGVFIIEWVEPIIGSGHWVPDLVKLAGGQSLLAEPGQSSRVVAWDEVRVARPDVLFVAPCGRTLDEALNDAAELVRLPGWDEVPAVRDGRVYVLDGSVCSRHGPRVVDVAETFARLLHPGAGWQGPAPVDFRLFDAEAAGRSG